MAELIAQGSASDNRWRRELPLSQSFRIGRTAGWSVPWDKAISGSHADLSWEGSYLKVERLSEARNPVFFKGAAKDVFRVKPGEHFVIGQTRFTLSDELVDLTLEAPNPESSQRYTAQELRRIRFQDADLRLEVLTHLPEMIDRAADDAELFQMLSNVLLSGAPSTEAVGIVRLQVDANGAGSDLEVLKWDRRRVTGRPFSPSRRLVEQAVTTGQTVLFCWPEQPAADQPFTMVDETAWAVACPVRGPHTPGWCLYLVGKDLKRSPNDSALDDEPLRDDIKFTELVSSILAKLVKLKALQREQATLGQFFSPLVLDALSGADPEHVLAPKQTEVSVLFCDLRGFSRRTEQQASDLMGLLKRVSRVLGLTTEAILEFGGVVGDFHGDAAMGFWGWPVSSNKHVELAVRAALSIREQLADAQRMTDEPLAEFQMGLGLATGTAVAGKIGTKDQVKVTVFGPVVNLSARLESMTRQLRVPILIDHKTAEFIREHLLADICRVRRLAAVRPFGMDEVIEVSELRPPANKDEKLTDDQINSFERAWQLMVEGDWSEAMTALHTVPADDRAKDFLTVYIAQHDRTPPADWEGFIPLTKK